MRDGSDFFCLMALVGMMAGLVWYNAEPRIYPQSVAFAQSSCASNGGWEYIEEGRNEDSSVKCKNGAEFSYKWEELRKVK
ncbi:hypothetical protein ACQCLI_18195 [Pseudomonas nitroreducens]|uniref:hypothetical protein n=1 Tax=Pseudomonas nitroreducens TaxID=46680 RepID=UPI00037C512D|nr:hypothetical protein [Pseudomonas nitroreducens]